jgi:hypothetical protein
VLLTAEYLTMEVLPRVDAFMIKLLSPTVKTLTGTTQTANKVRKTTRMATYPHPQLKILRKNGTKETLTIFGRSHSLSFSAGLATTGPKPWKLRLPLDQL